jgi:hypothetical protein
LEKLGPDMVRITGTDRRGAGLSSEYLEGIDHGDAHLEGVDLSTAYGDAKTRLPDGFPPPARWPAFDVSS